MEKKYKFGFIGTGAYGSALANALTTNNYEVIMYGINEKEISDINNGLNTKYFNQTKFTNPELISATKSLEYVLNNSEIIVLAVPSFAIGDVIDKIIELRSDQKFNIINIAKGFESSTRMFFSEFIKQKMKNNLNGFATILGPSFAQELFEKKTTVINIIGDDIKFNKLVAQAFRTDYFALSQMNDWFMAELFASLKNTLAIGMGILSHYDDSKNTTIAFLTMGVKEILAIYNKIAKEKKYKSVFDFSTFGDVVLTCTSDKSRNYSYGKYLAENGLERANSEYTSTVEGKEAAKVLAEILYVEKIQTTIFKLIISILMGKTEPDKINSFLKISKEIV
ncbi:NAD(P)H-dependent glycerol-3-phosphate dehydrogenase [Mycoplasmopsis edwardii]|uniref:NAD(P)-binding domain-containing protein n=1 Tax=Mycoplasmopsis edwardii TaxID=53558 RepID=A0ACD4PHT5_9BACT|nr:NAD(P)H-dependent glycerol-3-phosphate dehydrogenase [Mycoplasmopsis edwardii]WBP84195.1 NAD(P)-binding domain-containing protein [Mycoplasmopsis edwardii]